MAPLWRYVAGSALFCSAVLITESSCESPAQGIPVPSERINVRDGADVTTDPTNDDVSNQDRMSEDGFRAEDEKQSFSRFVRSITNMEELFNPTSKVAPPNQLKVVMEALDDVLSVLNLESEAKVFEDAFTTIHSSVAGEVKKVTDSLINRLNHVVPEIQDFVASVMNMNENVDVTSILSGAWITEFKDTIDRLSALGEKAVANKGNPSTLKVIVMRMSTIMKDLADESPYTRLVIPFNASWMQESLTKFQEFGSNLREMLKEGKTKAAVAFFDESNEIVESIRTFGTRIREHAAKFLPGAVVKALRDYEKLLMDISKPVANAIEELFVEDGHTRLTKVEVDADEDEIDQENKDNEDKVKSYTRNPLEPFVEIPLLKARAILHNTVQGFINFVVDTLDPILDVLQLNHENMVIMPFEMKIFKTAADSGSEARVTDLAFIGEEMKYIEGVKGLMSEITSVCKEIMPDGINKVVCQSVQEAIGGVVGAEEPHRALQSLFPADSHQYDDVTSLVPSILPRIQETIAKVPQLFPILTAATTSTVDALVDSSNIVASSVVNTATDVRDRLRGSIVNRQFPIPVLP